MPVTGHPFSPGYIRRDSGSLPYILLTYDTKRQIVRGDVAVKRVQHLESVFRTRTLAQHDPTCAEEAERSHIRKCLTMMCPPAKWPALRVVQFSLLVACLLFSSLPYPQTPLFNPTEEEMNTLRHLPDKVDWSAYSKYFFHILSF